MSAPAESPGLNDPVVIGHRNSISPARSATDSVVSEAPQPYDYNNAEQGEGRGAGQPYGNADTRSRRSSIFASTNSVGAYPDAEAHVNPLVKRQSKLEKDVEEAQRIDDELAQETIHSSDYWARKLKGLWILIRPDFILRHLNWVSTKTVARTWICVFVTIILMVVNASGDYIGQATYLLTICAVIEAAGGISIAHAFYTGLLDMAMVLFCFMFNVVACAICWSIRNYPSREDAMQQLVDEGLCKAHDTACYLHQVHKGKFLTTKTSVVSLIAIIFALTIAGYIQTLNKALTPSWIFGVICTLITGLYILMDPTFDPWTYGKVVVIPIGFSLSVRFVASVLVFPITSNYKFLTTLVAIMDQTNQTLHGDLMDLKHKSISDPEFDKLLKTVDTKISAALGKFALLKIDGLIMRGELAYARVDPGDLGELRSLLRSYLTAVAGLTFYFHQLVEKRELIEEYSPSRNSTNSSNSDYKAGEGEGYADDSGEQEKKVFPRQSSSNALAPSRSGDRLEPARSSASHVHVSSQEFSYRHTPLLDEYSVSASKANGGGPSWLRKNKWLKKQLSRAPAHVADFEEDRFAAAEALDFDSMFMADLEKLQQDVVLHYARLAELNLALFQEVLFWAKAANGFRNFAAVGKYREKRIAEQKERNEKLQAVKDELQHHLDDGLQKNYTEWARHYCKPQNVRSRQHYSYTLTMDALYGCVLERVAECVSRLASYCLLVDQHRPVASVIFPFMKMISRSPRFEAEYNNSEEAGLHLPMHSHEDDPVYMVQARSPDSLLPRTVLHLAGRQVKKVWNFFSNPRLIFCVKRAIVSVAVSLLFVCRTTVYFAYSQRIIWVPVMTALTISHHAVDGIYGFIVKLLMTLLGSVFGMLIWYLGDASGRGNAYGFVAASMAVLTFSIYYRHFHSLAIPMGAIVLNVTIILVSGTSWGNVHQHAIDTNIGYGWSVAWRRFLTVTIGVTAAFIGTVLPHPSTAKKHVRVIIGKSLEQIGDVQAGASLFMVERTENSEIHIAQRTDPIVRKIRRLKQSIKTAQGMVSLIDYEPPLGGVWPKHRYMLLMQLTEDVVQLLEDIYFIADRVSDSRELKAIMQRTGWADIDLMSDLYAVLVLCSRALTTGDPLPSVTPGHLSEMYSTQLRRFLDFDAAQSNQDLEGLLESRYVRHDGRLVLAAVSKVSAFYKRVDSCLFLIKGLVGEIYPVDHKMFKHNLEHPPLLMEPDSKEDEDIDLP